MTWHLFDTFHNPKILKIHHNRSPREEYLVILSSLEKSCLPKLNCVATLDWIWFFPSQLKRCPFLRCIVCHTITLKTVINPAHREKNTFISHTLGQLTRCVSDGIFTKVPNGSVPFINRPWTKIPLIGSFDSIVTERKITWTRSRNRSFTSDCFTIWIPCGIKCCYWTCWRRLRSVVFMSW